LNSIDTEFTHDQTFIMKTRESGMPSEEMWQGFFDPEVVLEKLNLTADCQCVVDLGCGYGTFSIPAARLIQGTVYAIDIDPDMVAATAAKAGPNLTAMKRDLVESGSGLADHTADYVMLFNILHAMEASILLQEATRILRPGGLLGVIHWNYDPTTPRGPSMEIRLQPEQCLAMVRRSGFDIGPIIDLPPHHFGFVGTR
jgi:SAM-dependent methyltransferase